MPAGFTVNPDAIDRGGRTACDLAEDLRSARSTWDSATRDGEACGMDLVREAYTKMQDAWFDEVGVHITILEQLCSTLRGAADSYRGSDDAAGASFGGNRVE